MDLSAVRARIAEDMSAVDALILRSLRSDVVLINQIGAYIVNSGGKRLRPMIVLLAARAAGYSGRRHRDLAAIIEFIHTATLLHDDVVDGSKLRRNRETANEIWGNEASVLVGDFLYSRSFEMMVAVNNMRVMDILSAATNRIAEGEVLQLLNCNNPDTTEQQYLEVIERKTATLFEAGTRLGAVLGGLSETGEQALAAYGLQLGVAFQLVDDVLDSSADGETLGKNIGDDLAEGKPTLPIIQAISAGTRAQQIVLRRAVETGGVEHIDRVMEAIESTDAIAYTAGLAEAAARRAKQALRVLPASADREALETLADFAVRRAS
jgi:octaprenyl-diphosphate synthase